MNAADGHKALYYTLADNKPPIVNQIQGGPYVHFRITIVLGFSLTPYYCSLSILYRRKRICYPLSVFHYINKIPDSEQEQCHYSTSNLCLVKINVNADQFINSQFIQIKKSDFLLVFIPFPRISCLNISSHGLVVGYFYIYFIVDYGILSFGFGTDVYDTIECKMSEGIHNNTG